MTYEQADQLLQGRCRSRRKLENHTYLERHAEREIAPRKWESSFTVCLHSTDILSMKPDGMVEINTGGWNTITTRDRLNRYLPAPWHVASESNMLILYRAGRDGSWYKHPVCLVNPRATVKADGTAHGGDYAVWREATDEVQREHRRAVRRLRYWILQGREVTIDRTNCARRSDCRTSERVTFGRRWNSRPDFTPGDKDCGCVVTARVRPSSKLTVPEVLAEPNVSIRLAMMHCYGFDRFLLDAGAEVINEGKGYQLLSLEFEDWRATVHSLKMTCPSTGAVYLNAVPPHTRSVREALDWMFDTQDYLGQVGQQT